MNFSEVFFSTVAFSVGACIGSFLNVCIYRMPLNMSINEPKRSFCPKCKYQIPWYSNLPLITWLFQRGKCANCKCRIPFRYFGVELLTASLFLALWYHTVHISRGLPDSALLVVFPFWIMASLFIVATFIDFEHFIIPDEITWGGAGAGVILSLLIPTLHGSDLNWWQGGLQAVIGGALGYFLLWGVVEAGKLAFGKKAFAMRKPMEFSWTRRPAKDENGKDLEESDADLVVGDVSWKNDPEKKKRVRKADEPERGESWIWSETFGRESDQLKMRCPTIRVDEEEFTDAELVFFYDRLKIGERTWELEKTNKITGVVSSLIIPREAMGFGDVKYMACVGAFLGWKAVLFTVVIASTLGAFIGILTLLVGKREWSAKIPFGPYLSAGALLWVFYGPQAVDWYWALANPAAIATTNSVHDSR